MKESVIVKFVDFWPTFNPEDNKFVEALRVNRDVVVLDSSDDTAPDILFYSRCGYKHYEYDCLKIYFTGENDFPDFNECDYAISFYESDCGGRNLRYPLYMLYEIGQASDPPVLSESDAFEREFCSLVMSNSVNCHPKRIEIVDAVQSYRPIAYGGSFRNNVGGRVAEKIPFINGYKFNLALENSIVPGYVTEKIIEPFAAATVPIYWGSDVVKKDFNPESFINVEDYSSFDSFLAALKRIDNSPDEYIRMLRASSHVAATTDILDLQLAEFLIGIADNPIRMVSDYGEIANRYYRNRILNPLSNDKYFFKASKLLLKIKKYF